MRKFNSSSGYLLKKSAKELWSRGQVTERSILRKRSTVAWDSAKPYSAIPKLSKIPFLSAIFDGYDTDRQHLAIKDKRRRLQSDIMRDDFRSHEVVVCFTAEDMREVFRNEGIHPYRVEYGCIKAYRKTRKEWYSKSRSFLVDNGKSWYDLRYKTQKYLLKPAAVQAYFEPMQDVARDFVERIDSIKDSNNEVPDLLHELYKWAVESVHLLGFETRLGGLETNISPDSEAWKLFESVLTQLECVSKLTRKNRLSRMWRIFPTPTWNKFVKASDVHAKIYYEYLKQAEDDIKQNKNNLPTLLHTMLAKGDLDASQVMVFFVDLLFGGVESTAHAVAFLLYHLARNPDKQELLHNEITELLPNKESNISTTNYKYFNYFKACFKESLRLNPVVGGTARLLANDTVLSGYQVPAGTFAYLSFDEVLRDERYFTNADKFVPERWLNNKEKPHPFSYLPFSYGPRSCLGKRLAEVETICLVTQIIRKFKLEYHYEDIGVLTKALNTPDKPLRFNFIER